MIKLRDTQSYSSFLLKAGILFMVLYGIVATILLFRVDPKPIIIGIDQYGTRVITSSEDPIVKRERISLVRRFSETLYNFTETTFDERASMVGDWMSDELWGERRDEFKALSERLKNEPLTQTGRILDIREIDENQFEVDLSVKTISRLRQSEAKLRVSIELEGATRSAHRPYPYQVRSYDEAVIN